MTTASQGLSTPAGGGREDAPSPAQEWRDALPKFQTARLPKDREDRHDGHQIMTATEKTGVRKDLGKGRKISVFRCHDDETGDGFLIRLQHRHGVKHFRLTTAALAALTELTDHLTSPNTLTFKVACVFREKPPADGASSASTTGGDAVQQSGGMNP